MENSIIGQQDTPLEELAERVVQSFKRHYGADPSWVVSAPGRVNLIGEHTDYNDGFVLPMAIERHTVIAAGSRSGQGRHSQGKDNPAWEVASDACNGVVTFPVDSRLTKGNPEWSNYVRGVVAGFRNRGTPVPALCLQVGSSVPLGGGLSSSAALEVSTATLLEVVTGRKLEPLAKAELCQKAEHDYAGVPCGIMDQLTSVAAQAGHALLIDCRLRSTALVRMMDPGVTVLIINSGVRHSLAGGEYAKRRAQCEAAARSLGLKSLRDATLTQLEAARGTMDTLLYRRARHVISENDRALRVAPLIHSSQWDDVGELMYASHRSLKEDYEVSCAELDIIVEIVAGLATSGDVIGCRMTGGGFGGCAVALVRSSACGRISEVVREQYRQRTGIEPSLFSSRPGSGPRILRSPDL